MVRTPCRDERGMKKGTWTPEEDRLLVAYVTRYGCWNWRQLPKFAGLARCGKSCRLRWLNYLRPNVKRGNYTNEEEEIIIRLHAMLGNKWSAIAAELEGRTDNEVKNHWHTNLKKRVMNSKNNKAPSSSISITRHEEIEAPKTRDHQPKSATTSSIASDSENVDTTNVVDPHKIYLVEYLDYAGLWSPQPTSSSELSSVANDATAFADAASDGVRVMEDNATSGAAIETFYGDFGGSFWTNSSFLGDNYSYNPSGLYTPPPLMEPEEFLYPSFDGEFMYAL